MIATHRRAGRRAGEEGDTFHTADGAETYTTGDAYYIPPAHTPELFAGTEVVEFHPTAELAKTMEVVERNMAEQG